MSLLQNKNYASSLLIGAISDSDTSVTLTSSTGTLFPSTGYFMAAIWGSAYASPSLDPNRELVKATLSSGDTFTITRSQEGTTNKAWSIGDNFALVFTAGKMDEAETAIQSNLLSFAIATGTNTYTAVLDPAITAYANGLAFNIKFTNASTGASTLQLNALAAKKIYRVTAGSYVQVGSGDIIAGLYSTVFYNSALDSSAGGWILVSAVITIPVTFASTTALLFPQAAAPTGWTLDSSWSTPRSIILGNSYASGGSSSATSFTTGITVGAHATHRHVSGSHTHTTGSLALTIAQMPAHTHTGGTYPIVYYYGSGYLQVGGANTGHLTGSAGSGAAHNHGSTGSGGGVWGSYGGPTTHSVGQSSYSPRYVQVIRATKD